MDGGAWWAIVHGVTKSRTWLSDFTHSLTQSCHSYTNGTLSSQSQSLFKPACAFHTENETFLLLGWERRCQYLPYFTFSHCCESGGTLAYLVGNNNFKRRHILIACESELRLQRLRELLNVPKVTQTLVAEFRLKPRRLSYPLIWRSAAQMGLREPVSFVSSTSPEPQPRVLLGCAVITSGTKWKRQWPTQPLTESACQRGHTPRGNVADSVSLSF